MYYFSGAFHVVLCHDFFNISVPCLFLSRVVVLLYSFKFNVLLLTYLHFDICLVFKQLFVLCPFLFLPFFLFLPVRYCCYG